MCEKLHWIIMPVQFLSTDIYWVYSSSATGLINGRASARADNFRWMAFGRRRRRHEEDDDDLYSVILLVRKWGRRSSCPFCFLSWFIGRWRRPSPSYVEAVIRASLKIGVLSAAFRRSSTPPLTFPSRRRIRAVPSETANTFVSRRGPQARRSPAMSATQRTLRKHTPPGTWRISTASRTSPGGSRRRCSKTSSGHPASTSPSASVRVSLIIVLMLVKRAAHRGSDYGRRGQVFRRLGPSVIDSSLGLFKLKPPQFYNIIMEMGNVSSPVSRCGLNFKTLNTPMTKLFCKRE